MHPGQGVAVLEIRHPVVPVLGPNPAEVRPRHKTDIRLNLELGLEGEGFVSAIEFLGYREDIQSVISTFDINVLSSLWEGLPYALVEGMALGKVAVGPDISGCSDLIRDGHNGFLFPLRDHETLARHITRLLRDDELRARMGRAARAFVEERHSADLWIKRIKARTAKAAA